MRIFRRSHRPPGLTPASDPSHLADQPRPRRLLPCSPGLTGKAARRRNNGPPIPMASRTRKTIFWALDSLSRAMGQDLSALAARLQRRLCRITIRVSAWVYLRLCPCDLPSPETCPCSQKSTSRKMGTPSKTSPLPLSRGSKIIRPCPFLPPQKRLPRTKARSRMSRSQLLPLCACVSCISSRLALPRLLVPAVLRTLRRDWDPRPKVTELLGEDAPDHSPTCRPTRPLRPVASFRLRKAQAA